MNSPRCSPMFLPIPLRYVMILVLWALFFTPRGIAAEIKNPIRGFIVDATSGEPLPAANVVLQGMKIGASTNLDGYFVINNLAPGVYTLAASYLGYHNTAVKIEVTAELMEPIRIELLPSAVQMEEVVFTLEEKDEREERLSPKVSAIPLDAATLRRMPSLGGELDVLRSLQNLPGVKASSDVSSALYVRGGSPDQTLILMDHNVVYNPSHLFGLFSTFNADAVKHIELIKGGFPAEYGGRSGSVLEVITNEGNRKESEGMFSVGVISARAACEGPLPQKRGSYAVSARRTYMEPILDALRDAYDTDLPDYYFYDANGKINVDVTPRTTVSIAGYAGLDRMSFEVGPADSRSVLGLDWGNRSITGRVRHVLSRNLFLSVGAAISHYASSWKFDNDGVVIEDAHNRLNDFSVKSDLEYTAGRNHRVKTGFWISRYDFRLDISELEENYVDIDTATYNYSLYVQDTWRVHPLLELRPGVRGYYHQEGDFFRLDPRLALVLHNGPAMRFKLSGGRYTQWINLITFGEGASNFDIWVPVDATMKPAYANQIVLGFEWEPREDLEWTTETYYTDMRNIAAFDFTTTKAVSGEDAFVKGQGYAYGFEWMLRRKTGALTGWLGYSLAWTKRRFPDTYVNHGQWYYPKWDRRHDLVVVVQYELNRHWDFSGSWRFNTGQGFTQPLGIVTTPMAGVAPEFQANQGRMPVNGDLNNYRFPEDHRLDLTATYKHHFFGHSAKLNLSFYNVYSRRSYWMRTTDTSENPPAVTDLKLLPIVPMISYEVRF